MAFVKRSRSTPTLPRISAEQVAEMLREMLRDPFVGAQELALVVRQDPELRVRLLRLANSSYYGRRSEHVADERHAISWVGLEAVRHLIGDCEAPELPPAGTLYLDGQHSTLPRGGLEGASDATYVFEDMFDGPVDDLNAFQKDYFGGFTPEEEDFFARPFEPRPALEPGEEFADAERDPSPAA